MLTAFSTLVLIVIAAGLYFRKRKEIHMRLMLLAFAMDIGLLIYVELSAQAIKTFADEITHPVHGGLLFFHVAVSLLMVILYISQIVTGAKLFKGDFTHRALHRKMSYVFIACRLANYVTSFMVT